MKICAILSIILLALSSDYGGHSIYFRGGDLRTNLDRAADQDKLVFVDLTARWCHSCKLMEETTFKDPEVVQLINSNFVAIKLNADQIEGKLLAAQENVKTLPALMIMDASGRRLDLIQHAPSQHELIKMLKRSMYSAQKQLLP